MALAGNRDTRDIVVKTGVDATELKKFTIQDGTTYETIVGMLQAGLAGIANEYMSADYFGGLVNLTDNPEVSYRVGTNASMERFSEYGKPAFQRGETEGHMLPLIPYDVGLGWTWRSLEKAVMEDIQADITVALNAVRDRYRVSTLTRLLQRADDLGSSGVPGLGTTGISPGFATTAASTGVDFVPPSYGGKSFLNTHEHYVANAGSGSITTAETAAMREHLREHGHMGPYEMWISNDDRTVWEALSGFALAKDVLIAQYASTTVVSTLSKMDGFVGTIHDFIVKVAPGMPNNYCFGFKPYGQNNPMNPLRVRVPKGKSGLDLRLLTDGASPSDPLRGMTIFTEFGVGVGKDRTNGTPEYSNSGTWSDGTPT